MSEDARVKKGEDRARTRVPTTVCRRVGARVSPLPHTPPPPTRVTGVRNDLSLRQLQWERARMSERMREIEVQEGVTDRERERERERARVCVGVSLTLSGCQVLQPPL